MVEKRKTKKRFLCRINCSSAEKQELEEEVLGTLTFYSHRYLFVFLLKFEVVSHETLE